MKTLFCKQALLADGWASNVAVEINKQGLITHLQKNAKPLSETHDLVIPGMANVHSHAFQIALQGRAQQRSKQAPNDGFFAWRNSMYNDANSLSSEQFEILAQYLYLEMLKAGYTSVGEFHYLHHQPNGQHYEPREKHSQLLCEVAKQIGIGLTLLPVLYCQANFDVPHALPEQKRFLHNAQDFLFLIDSLNEKYKNTDNINIGLALHSLRAVPQDTLVEVLNSPIISGSPTHIHIAEPIKEVEKCLEHTASRPIELLLNLIQENTSNFNTSNLCLIHATHMNEAELQQIKQKDMTIGFCPTTEADLGDGLALAYEYNQAQGSWAIGSDQNSVLNPFVELYLFEMGQRLKHEQRIVLGSGTDIYQKASLGGAKALKRSSGSIAVGMQADLLFLDTQSNPILDNKSPSQVLDAIIFSPNFNNPIQHVMVQGNWVIKDKLANIGIDEAKLQQQFKDVLKSLNQQ